MNGVSITTSGTTLSNVASVIGSSVTNVTASVNSTTGNLEIFHNGKALGDSTGGTNTIRFEEVNGTLVADLGLTSNEVLNGVKFLQDNTQTDQPGIQQHQARTDLMVQFGSRPQVQTQVQTWLLNFTPHQVRVSQQFQVHYTQITIQQSLT